MRAFLRGYGYGWLALHLVWIAALAFFLGAEIANKPPVVPATSYEGMLQGTSAYPAMVPGTTTITVGGGGGGSGVSASTNCARIDANGNITDSAVACAGGAGSVVITLSPSSK